MTRPELSAAAVALSALAAAALVIALPHGSPEVMFFDVGQGDATLVQRGSMQVLIDGGPDDSVLAKLGDAMPFFDRTIEIVVLTHPDKDHFGGLASVLSRYRVGTVLTDGLEDSGPVYRRFADTLAGSGAAVRVVRTGDALALGDRVRADVLWPPVGNGTSVQNDMSVMLRLIIDGSPVAMLAGDATAGAERELLGDDISAPVLKAGHHGSAYSNSAAFLDAVRPSAAVVSVGARNRYGHPAASVLYRFVSRDLAVFRTDRQGDIHLMVADGGDLRVCAGTVPFLSACARVHTQTVEQIRPASYTDANPNDI